MREREARRLVHRALRQRLLEGIGIGLALGLLAGIVIGRTALAAPRPAPVSSPVPTGPERTEAPGPFGASLPPSPAVPSVAPTADYAPGWTPGAAASEPGSSPTPVEAVPPASGSLRPRESVVGLASWYCLPGSSTCTRGYAAGGPYAAAGPALRVGTWRGRWVRVTAASGAAVRVRLVDWCQCPGKVIDLYASQFARLAPLSRGVVRVEVSW